MTEQQSLQDRLRVYKLDRRFDEDRSILSTLKTLREKLPLNTPTSNEIIQHLNEVTRLINARVESLAMERDELIQLCQGIAREGRRLRRSGGTLPTSSRRTEPESTRTS